VFVDQEGGSVRAYRSLPPLIDAWEYTDARSTFAAGRATGRALRRQGVLADLAPVLDAPDGPLGSRHFRRPSLAVAFARGLRAAGVIACAKHFPGLGSTSESTDSRRPVHGVVRRFEVAGFARAIATPVPCVMVSHAIYDRFGEAPASISPRAYRLLRKLGFQGVAITDELGVLGPARAPEWATRAVLAGADLVLYSRPADALRALAALTRLARTRTRALDAHVVRVLLLRAAVGL
jgi:beta-N-acetylhexosaminidase